MSVAVTAMVDDALAVGAGVGGVSAMGVAGGEGGEGGDSGLAAAVGVIAAAVLAASSEAAGYFIFICALASGGVRESPARNNSFKKFAFNLLLLGFLLLLYFCNVY
jgi:hypothetical protein